MSNLDSIVRMEFGSVVYGTTVPSSDVDINGIYIPEARDIIMGSVKESINYNTKQGTTTKNTADDRDEKYYSLKKYINLLLEGQTVAIDMLFVPKNHHIDSEGFVWREIISNKDKFLYSGYSSFVGYCRTQANKYGIKGSRMNAVKDTIEFLTHLISISGNTHERLSRYEFQIQEWTKNLNNEFVLVEMLQNAQKTILEPYLQVCNRKVPFHSTIKYAIQVYHKIYDEYGHRAKLAQSNEGIDWKALMHAVRIANQAKELLLTHQIVFPRPEAESLLKIRKGELPYQEVAEMIEQGLQDIELAAAQSTLPEKPNYDWANELVYDTYLRKCVNYA